MKHEDIYELGIRAHGLHKYEEAINHLANYVGLVDSSDEFYRDAQR